jgi:hypothetical protein
MSSTDLVAAAAEAQEPLDPNTLADVGAWVVSSLRDAEWAFENVGESEAEVASIDEMEADAHARIKARADELRAKALRRAEYFRGRLAEFATANKADLLLGKKKSRELLAGTFAWRTKNKGGALVVTDKDALASWLAGQDPSLFRVTLSPEMTQLQKLFHEQGIVPPGCDFKPEVEELTLKANPLPLLSSTPPAKEMKP